MNAEFNIMGSLNILDAAWREDLEKLVFAFASSVVGAVEAVESTNVPEHSLTDVGPI